MPDYRLLNENETIQIGDETYIFGEWKLVDKRNVGLFVENAVICRPLKVPSWEEVHQAQPCPYKTGEPCKGRCEKCTYETTLKLMGIEVEE